MAARGPRLTRRRLLKIGGVVGASAALGWCRFLDYSEAGGYSELACFSARQGAILAAAVSAILPPDADRKPATLGGHVAAIDAYLVGLEGEHVKQLGQLLYLLEHLTLPFGGHFRRLSRLSLADRRDCLRSWQRSSIDKLRCGLRALVSLVFLAYYRNDDAFYNVSYGGPLVRAWQGTDESRARYDHLLAPEGAEP